MTFLCVHTSIYLNLSFLQNLKVKYVPGQNACVVEKRYCLDFYRCFKIISDHLDILGVNLSSSHAEGCVAIEGVIIVALAAILHIKPGSI